MASQRIRKSALKRRIHDINQQKWHSDVHENSQCTFYRTFKEALVFEDYINLLDRKDAINLTKFRCRNHKLPVSRTKYPGYLPESIKCKLCNSNELGDEFHYLFKCKHLENERKLYLGQTLFRSPNIFTIQRVMNDKSIHKLKKLAKFVAIILNKFRKESFINVHNTDVNIVADEQNTDRTASRSGRRICRPIRLDL